MAATDRRLRLPAEGGRAGAVGYGQGGPRDVRRVIARGRPRVGT